MQTTQTQALPITRRLMLPETEQITQDAADLEDARKIRYGFSPSYFLNLGSLTGNRYTGHMQIYPRTLYRFDRVFPTGINEDPERIDERKGEQPPFATVTRHPRTCAEDVRSEAAERVFAILTVLTDRDDAQEIWDLIYPVEVEAKIFAKTDRAIRGPVPPYLLDHYRRMGLEIPYVIEGHALAEFIQHLERMEFALAKLALKPSVYEVAEATRKEMLQAANDAFQYRSARLNGSFGSIESRQNSGVGKKQLDKHDWQCIAETGIQRPEDKPVAASQKMGAAMGEAIAKTNEESQSQLAQAVTMIAEGQQNLQQQLALQSQAILELLQDRRSNSAGT
jgi:hypothetical protein